MLFFSDNGGALPHANNAPLRAGKGGVYEGGIRVAAAVRWPGGGLSGGKIVRHRMGYIDVYPTLEKLVGGGSSPGKPLDGADVLEAMRGGRAPGDRPWYSYFAPGSSESAALNTNEWKLVVIGADARKARPDSEAVRLFRISEDPGEVHDVKAQHPEIAADLLEKLGAFRDLKIDGVKPNIAGRSGFVAPTDWIIRN